ncbi:MAG: small, acid-soluble spore protein, alpha/beta type [Sedimentibacter sp.]
MNKNNLVSPEAKQALQQFKMEAARELDIAKPQEKDRANMTSRQNGYVGGYAESSGFNIK